MVDALRSAGRVLRPGGVVVDLQPADVYRPRLAIVAPGGTRTPLGAIARDRHPGIAAAHRARRAAVAEGVFDRVVSLHAVHRGRYRGPRDLQSRIAASDNWHLDPAMRRRLAAAWARRPRHAVLELRQPFSLSVLRKRARRGR
ncbi:MAG TPA: hypothetical protein VJP45_10075 [Candidatus Limnocylindria bacterium]|nr:hypothetical protein [Candidatus Limnocylindria bacterium]